VAAYCGDMTLPALIVRLLLFVVAAFVVIVIVAALAIMVAPQALGNLLTP
jgi:hypothetical protein